MPLIWLFVALANDNCVKMQESFPIIPIPIDRPIVASRSPDRPISDFCVNSAALVITFFISTFAVAIRLAVERFYYIFTL